MHRNQIDLVAIAGIGHRDVFRDLSNLANYASRSFVAHNGKFDFKVLLAKGAPISIDQWVDDTNVMAVALANKIPPDWLERYEVERKTRNAQLGRSVHRHAGKHSLKTLAPYWLGVEPFWEVADHNDEEYAHKDALYTLQLKEVLEDELKKTNGFEFYRDCLFPWTKMLFLAEVRGVSLDFDLMGRFEKEYEAEAAAAEIDLRRLWAPHYEAHLEIQRNQIKQERAVMKAQALAKMVPSKKKTPELAAKENAEKIQNIVSRYDEGERKALAEKVKPLNLGSHKQLNWLLKEALQLDITTFDGEDESTDKKVLKRLEREGALGVKELLSWRGAEKIISYFHSYQKQQVDGYLYSNFNVDVARTGRLSSDKPNFQQIPKSVFGIFQARPDYTFVYRDASAVEPRILAYTTECAALCKIFIEGSDFHSHNVRAMMGIEEDDATIKAKYEIIRDAVKEFGLALMYGAGPGRIEECAAKRGIRWTFKECKKIFQAFQREYHEVWTFKEQLEARIQSGEIIHNIFDRPLSYEGTNLHMTSLNTLIQSGGSDLLLASAFETLKRAKTRGLEVHPLLYIHDAVAIETPKAQGQQVFDLLGDVISSWQLPLTDGRLIPMKSEGKIGPRLGKAS